MKRIILIIAAVGLLAGCHVDPVADFAADYRLVEPYEIIHFTNLSDHADYFDWDFGDGYYTDVVHPNHFYDYEGLYTVSLTAFNDGYTDRAFMDIEVYETSLEIAVYEWNSGYYLDNPIPGAEVTLYLNAYDWEHLINPVISGYTNSQGIVTFKRLDPISYYIDVYHDYYHNYWLGQDDINFVRTEPLAWAHLNEFVAWVDYDPGSRAEKRSNKNLKINKAPRTFKKIELSK